jgi:hypothetical protein
MIDQNLISAEDNNQPLIHLITIAAGDYNENHFEILPNAVEDSKAIRKALIPKYRVQLHAELHENFTRDKINDAFTELKKIANPQDSLLVVYNGHAVVDNSLYWIPSHGRRGGTKEWFDTSDIFAFINKLDIAHVALIVNCCNSANIYNQQKTGNGKLITEGKSRVLLTSGKIDQSVSDISKTSLQNSPFTEGIVRYFDEINDRTKVSLNSLFEHVKDCLFENSSYQDPIYMPFYGDQGTGFYFTLTDDDNTYWKKQDTIRTIESYTSYKHLFPNGKKVDEANERISQLFKESNLWLETLNGVKAVFEKFIDDSNELNGNFYKEAEERIKVLAKEISDQSTHETIDRAWESLQISQNPDDFENFNNTYRDNQHKEIAEKRRKYLEKKQIADSAWEEIINKVEPKSKDYSKIVEYLKIKRNALIAFVSLHPGHLRANDAKEKKEDVLDYFDAENERDRAKKIIKSEKYKLRDIPCEYKSHAQKQIDLLKAENQFERFSKDLESDDINLSYQIREEIKGCTTESEVKNLEPISTEVGKRILGFERERQSDFDRDVICMEINIPKLVAFIEKYKAIEEDATINLVLEALDIFYEEERICHDKANQEDKIDDFDEYLSKFQAFEKGIKIRGTVHELGFIGKVKIRLADLNKDKAAFETATTWDKLELYLTDVESKVYVGKYLKQAEERIKQFEREQRKQGMYERVMQENTIISYKEFRDKFGVDADDKAEAVERNLANLEMIRDRKQLYEDILNEENLLKQIELCQGFYSKYTDDGDGQYTERVKEIEDKAIEQKDDNDAFDAIEKADTYEGKLKAIADYLSKEKPKLPEKAGLLKDELLAEIDNDTKEFKNAKNLASIDDRIESTIRLLNKKSTINKGEYNPRTNGEAQTFLNELEEEKKDIEAFDWVEKNENTPEGWLKYIRSTKNEKLKNLAHAKRDDLISINEEIEMFEKVKSQKSEQICSEYLAKHENGANRQKVKELNAQIVLGIEDTSKVSESAKIKETITDFQKTITYFQKTITYFQKTIIESQNAMADSQKVMVDAQQIMVKSFLRNLMIGLAFFVIIIIAIWIASNYK